MTGELTSLFSLPSIPDSINSFIFSEIIAYYDIRHTKLDTNSPPKEFVI